MAARARDGALLTLLVVAAIRGWDRTAREARTHAVASPTAQPPQGDYWQAVGPGRVPAPRPAGCPAVPTLAPRAALPTIGAWVVGVVAVGTPDGVAGELAEGARRCRAAAPPTR